MKLSAVLLAMLEDQFRHELTNSLRYLTRSSWARYRGLEATADLFKREADGETDHANRIRAIIEDRNEALVPAPYSFDETPSWNDVPFADGYRALFETAQAVEWDTTARLNAIYSAAFAEQDYQLCEKLSWLLNEQVEEENLYQTILDRITSRGADVAAIHDIDVWIREQFLA